MHQRDSFYFLSLLHELGKFIEIAQLPEWDSRADKFLSIEDDATSKNYLRYSLALFEYIQAQKPDLFLDETLITALFSIHHENEGEKGFSESSGGIDVLLKLIRIAADCASMQAVKISNDDSFKLSSARPHSIFNEIKLKVDECSEMVVPAYCFLDVNPLSIEEASAFPFHSTFMAEDSDVNLYIELAKQFLKAFSRCNSADELLYLIEKYLHAVPAERLVQGDGKELRFCSAINLYDHIRTTTAIALCFYDEFQYGKWNGRKESILDDSGNGYKNHDFPEPCILISGDLSGIQDFIFNIPSKKAAKSLKGRSYFVQLLAEVFVRYLMDELDLKPVNLLFNGGGNFFILAPACKQKAFESCSERISRILLEQECELSVDLANVSVSIRDFGNFTNIWDNVKMAVNSRKRVKYQHLDFGTVFLPFSQRNPENDDPYNDLTAQLVKSEGYLIRRIAGKQPSKGWAKIFNELGYEVVFLPKETATKDFGRILFNSCDFEGRASGFTFAVKSLPHWDSQSSIDEFEELMALNGCRLPEDEDQTRRVNTIKTFEVLAGHACIETGTSKLGVLKMDVDNLGKIFSEGLNSQKGGKSPARMMVLSRQLKWFFEAYMNKLIDASEGTLYPIFSGGDDFFLVGAWQDVFEFALKVNDAFSRFVCHHPGITLSASLLVVDEHYPVSRFAALAEERLHKAKYDSLGKNCINVFGQNLSWEKFAKAREIKEKLKEHVNAHGEAKAVIQKVIKSCEGLELIFKRAVLFAKAQKTGNTREHQLLVEQKPTGIKIWRLAYFLREIKEYSKDFVEGLIEDYEDVFFRVVKGEAVNPMYIAVGARWAEMSVRGKKPLLTKKNDNDGRQTV